MNLKNVILQTKSVSNLSLTESYRQECFGSHLTFVTILLQSKNSKKTNLLNVIHIWVLIGYLNNQILRVRKSELDSRLINCFSFNKENLGVFLDAEEFMLIVEQHKQSKIVLCLCYSYQIITFLINSFWNILSHELT